MFSRTTSQAVPPPFRRQLSLPRLTSPSLLFVRRPSLLFRPTPHHALKTVTFPHSLPYSTSQSPPTGRTASRSQTAMSGNRTLFQPQPTAQVNELVNTLTEAKAKKKSGAGFFCKKTTYTVEGSPIQVDSWKFLDHDYKKKNLPTSARGLFTCKNPITGDYEFAARGYDKFFNINEVQRTKWEWIAEHTKAPYELTVKENGCIIFISALPDDTLLVCSKHSTGARQDVERSHASVGESWIDRQLEMLGKTRRDFARTLREDNITVVAELCDDSFEEHILAYEEDRAGLYLHGVNLRVPMFATYPAAEVHKFADQWGFKKVDFFEKDNAKDLQEFLEKAAETGSWDGIDVEGFVVRCKARFGPDDPEWHDWFFKYKFDEPYLMYRQWRECTKALIAKKTPKIRNHQAITKKYLDFAAEYFAKNPGAAGKYIENHGIIKLRDAFLAHSGLKGSDIIKREAEEASEEVAEEGNFSVRDNVVLVSIATIGCGKTTVARGLHELFGWGHIQNDDISARKGKSKLFADAISGALRKHPAVFADRNNHQKRERGQLFDDIPGSNASSRTRFVALHYVHPRHDYDRIKNATKARVFGRGNNHQTIQAASRSGGEVEGIMDGFLDRFQPVDIQTSPDSSFDAIIDLDPVADSRANLETVVSKLKELYPNLIPKLPSSENYDRAIEASLNYTPNTSDQRAASAAGNKSKGRRGIEYFALTVPASSINSILESTFEGKSKEVGYFWAKLKETCRVQASFHVTLVHSAQSKSFLSEWQRYQTLLERAGSNANMEFGRGSLVLKNIVWNERLMAIEVKLLGDMWKTTNRVAHITVGTADRSISPVESNRMLEQWQDWEARGQVESIKLDDIQVEGIAKAIEKRR